MSNKIEKIRSEIKKIYEALKTAEQKDMRDLILKKKALQDEIRTRKGQAE